ncbi:MAG: nuclear transport factor 2 family protein, partial [Rhizorhabdus sp.]
YALAVDSQRWDLFDQVFTSDADVDFGSSGHWTNLERQLAP